MSSFNLLWLLFSSLKRLTKKEAEIGAIIPLLFINSKIFPLKPAIHWLFLIESSVIVFVLSREVSSTTLVNDTKTFFTSS